MLKKSEKQNMDEASDVREHRPEKRYNLDQYYHRLMLHTYEQNLRNVRLLARYKVRKRLAEGLEPDDPDPAQSRKKFATHIAQELYDSLLFYPGSNPVVDEIREELSQVLGKKVEFTYPPGGTLRIAVREETGLRHLEPEEQALAREHLKRITDARVDKGLLTIHTGINTRL